MKLKLQKSSSFETQTLVVFVAKADKDKKPTAVGVASGIQELLHSASEDSVFSGDKKESALYRNVQRGGAKNILFVGLGKANELDSEQVRIAAAVAFQGLRSSKATEGALQLDSILKLFKKPAEVVEAAAEGLLLSNYEYDELKSKKNAKKKDEKKELVEISLLVGQPTGAMEGALKRAEILSECQNFARRLGDAPGNYMTPSILANEAVKAAKGTGLKVTVWDKARIKKERFGGLLSVSLGSHEDPRFIIMEYKAAGAKKNPTVFVGKGLTFDTGGISIKPSQSMEEMKYDMCGGAAVIGAMLAIAKLKLKVNVVGLVPSTENMPGGAALKPGDVFFARNGKSVEVFNTDAEGRLILADALSYGTELKPAAMFDAATLTGAILIALGNTHTGVFTRNDKLMKEIQDAADETGELVWRLPLTDWHVEDMKGTHADLCNISNNRLAGSATAAAFLEQFVGEGIPWAHFDIAGTAWNVSSRFPYNPKKGASGVLVRTFVALAERS